MPRFAAWTLAAAAVLAGAGCAMTGDSTAAPESALPAIDPWTGTGLSVWDVDDRWWVFLEKSKDLAEFRKTGRGSEKSVTRVGAGPEGRTLKAPDAETLDAFAAWKPGFTVRTEKGRVWIFRENAKELAEFDKAGELAKQVSRIGAGPGGVTLKSPDFETLDAWAAVK